MKRLLILSILLLQIAIATAQNEAQKFKKQSIANKYLYKRELSAELCKYDFSKIFTKTESSSIFGFIGDNYQRIRIKFIRVTKDTSSPDSYHIFGKSMVKSNIENFDGTIKISNIRRYKETSKGLDGKLKHKGLIGQYQIIGDYTFKEKHLQSHSGIFQGSFTSEFYIDKNGNAHYDDIDSYADDYSNNQFVGDWNSYDGKLKKRCNWGDFRIPNSGKLDIGAGEFSPAPEYLKFGWQTTADF